MKIENSTKVLINEGAKPVRTQVKPRDESPLPQQDSVSINPLSAQLQALDTATPVDKHRVAAISQAIKDGHFTINSDAIARKVISSTKELLTSKVE